MKRTQALSVFRAYADGYDASDIKIAAKIAHTYRVAANAERIGKSLGMSAAAVDLAWFLGLLHDIGRFEQARRYGTFVDGVSVDHAALGADILFLDGLIDRFPTDGLPDGWRPLLETAIRAHNRLTLPDGLDDRTRTYCQIIRDADKIDIFRVVNELTFDERVGTGRDRFVDADAASPEVMACVYGHRCVPRDARRSVFDGHLSHVCMAFELVYPESRRMAAEQGYLARLFDAAGWPDAAVEQLRAAKRELENAWGLTI